MYRVYYWYKCVQILFYTESETHPPWQDPKFPTECFYLTVHCHRLSILASVRKYQRRLRAIRDLTRLVEEMEAAEIHWGHIPTVASRNRELVKKWKSQSQVSLAFTITTSPLQISEGTHIFFFFLH